MALPIRGLTLWHKLPGSLYHAVGLPTNGDSPCGLGRGGGSANLSIPNLEKVVDKLSLEWAPIAGAIYNDNSYVTVDSPSDGYSWNDTYGDVTNGQSGNSFKVDVVDNLSGLHQKAHGNNSSASDTFNMDCSWRNGNNNDLTYMTSGLRYATSLDSILQEMANMSALGLKRTVGDGSASGATDARIANDIYENTKLDVLKDTASTKAYYRIVTSAFRRDDRRWYNNYALIFYDFSLAPLLVEGVTAQHSKTEYQTGDSGSSERVNYFENGSQQESEASVEVSSDTEESVSNSMETTKSFTYTTELGVESKYGMEDLFGFLEVEQTISTKFGTETALETAWGSESTKTNSTHSGSTATVTLTASRPSSSPSRTPT